MTAIQKQKLDLKLTAIVRAKKEAKKGPVTKMLCTCGGNIMATRYGPNAVYVKCSLGCVDFIA